MLNHLTDRHALFWGLQIGGWLAFGVAMAFSRIAMYPLGYMALNKGVLTILGFVVTLGMWRLYRRLWSRHPSMARLVLAIVVCSYLASLVWTAAFNVVMEAYHDWAGGVPVALESWFDLVDGSLYHAFVLVAWSVLYVTLKYYDALQAEKERSLQAEARAHEARLQALRYQVHPHFLFNTLNAISTLVVEGRNGEATRMIARLSDFLRLTLDSPDAQEVPLVEEMEFAQRYLEIERIRFEGRLRTHVDIDPETYPALVPALILQPLVENAVRHGIAPREAGGLLMISARRVGDRLHLRVRDDGPGLPDSPPEAQRNGVGLANVRARLGERYGADHRFDLRRADGGGLAVTLELPFHTRPTMPVPVPTTEASHLSDISRPS